MQSHPIGGRLASHNLERNAKWAFKKIKTKDKVEVGRVSPYLIAAEPECSELRCR